MLLVAKENDIKNGIVTLGTIHLKNDSDNRVNKVFNDA